MSHFLHIRWPKYWSFSCSISPSNEYSGLISFRIDWFGLGQTISPEAEQRLLSLQSSRGAGSSRPAVKYDYNNKGNGKQVKKLHCGVKIGFFPASVTPGSRRGARAHLLKLFGGDFGTYCLLSTGESLLMLSTLKNKKVKVKSLSCVRLFATRGLYCSPPNSSVHGILQARILENSKWTVKPGELQSMGLQRVRHNLVTKQQQKIN